ncbi:MAG TPA: M50 family metallopeptidase [Solirubrobacterales bacterium]|nr:M50 family metallopeptidase [Solirubrobacterales bacterium]
MSWVWVFLGFSLLIVLHEAGHFVAAKATGMRVERFFLFFPPKLVSVRRGETEYGIGALPLGGFVKISGMNPEEEMPPEAEGRGYYDQPVWKRIVVIGAGPAVNILLAFALVFALAFGESAPSATVGQVEPGTPAAAAHLRHGDRILAVDGRSFAGMGPEERIERFGKLIAGHRCPAAQASQGCRASTPVELRIERGGQARNLSIFPTYDAGLGRTRIGFAYGTRPIHPGVGEAFSLAANRVWSVASGTLTAFAGIFEPQHRKELSGVVGISDVAHQVVGIGLRPALGILALVSLSLGLINLFPFLPLDGGHIFWSLVEKVRGEPVPFKVIAGASAVGFVLVAMLIMIGLSNDIGRLTGEGFHVR